MSNIPSKVSKAATVLATYAGNKAFEKLGREHYVKMGKKGSAKLVEKYGPSYFSRINRGEKPSQNG